MKTTGTLSFQRIASLMLCVGLFMLAMYLGSSLFIPIIYGIFFALMLLPVCRRFEGLIGSRVLSIVLTMATVGALLVGVVLFFIYELQAVMGEAGDIIAGLRETFYELIEYGGTRIGLADDDLTEMVEEGITGAVEAPIGILTSGLSTSGLLLANISLVLIYVFLFLLYRTALKRYVLSQFRPETRLEGVELLGEVQEVAKKYLGGMGLVMVILGVLNSLGLYLIGIDYFLVWGFLAAMLAVIPYIGTVIGGLLPFLYAISTTDTVWQPVAVVVLYGTVQFIEGNLITPKVVGNSVKINALAAIIAILFGALFWGVAGIVIAIPLLAMVRIIMSHLEPLRPYALLLSDDLYENSEKFLTEFSTEQYRTSRLLYGETDILRSRRRLVKKQPKAVGNGQTQDVTQPQAQQTYGHGRPEQAPIAQTGGDLHHENGTVEPGHVTEDHRVPVVPEEAARN